MIKRMKNISSQTPALYTDEKPNRSYTYEKWAVRNAIGFKTEKLSRIVYITLYFICRNGEKTQSLTQWHVYIVYVTTLWQFCLLSQLHISLLWHKNEYCFIPHKCDQDVLI